METEQEWRERGGTAGWNGVEKPRWHGCGVHSFKTLEALLEEFGGVLEREVVAEVVNYGRVDEFEHGYRAEHTRILKMYLIAEKDSQADFMEALRRILETRFGVPVVVTSLADLISEHAPDYKEQSGHEGTTTHAFITHAVTTLQQNSLSQNQPVVYVPAQWYLNGVKNLWPTSASASSATTTSPNRSQRRSGSPPPSSNPSPSNGSVVVYGGDIVDNYTLKNPAPKPKKKKPVESNLPANKKKWWLKR